MSLKVKYELKHIDAVVPTKATIFSAGYDMTATTMEQYEDFVQYGTGVHVKIPEGYAGFLFPRSSVSKKELMLANSVGVIDSDYRGEIKFRFNIVPNAILPSPDSDHYDEWKIYNPGERVGQLIIIKIEDIDWESSNISKDTERGDKGFGSSGE